MAIEAEESFEKECDAHDHHGDRTHPSQGRAHREVAQALFVTPKTVEVHLTSVYRKLDIGSRQELARALVDADPCLPGPSYVRRADECLR